jgi:hypothetical protein
MASFIDLKVSSTASYPKTFVVPPVDDDEDDDDDDDSPAVLSPQMVFKKHASPNGQPLPVGHSTLHLALASFKSIPQYRLFDVGEQLSIPVKQV